MQILTGTGSVSLAVDYCVIRSLKDFINFKTLTLSKANEIHDKEKCFIRQRE
jgi:hypothetical protein